LPRRLQTYLDFSQQFEKIETRLINKAEKPVRSYLGDISELCSSIKVHGLLQPIVVRPKGSHFEVVCGNRRLEACKQLVMRYVGCVVKDLTDAEAFELSIIENVQRRTLDALDEARAFRRYVTEFGWGGVSDLARRIGKSQVYVSHRIALLDLPDNVQQRLSEGRMSPSQAEELVWFGDPSKQGIVMSLLEDQKVSVKRIRRIRTQLEKETFDPFLGFAGGRRDLIRRGSYVDGSDNSADRRLVEDAILALRIALVRVDAAVSKVESESVKDPMMRERLSLHGIIDRLIRLKVRT